MGINEVCWFVSRYNKLSLIPNENQSIWEKCQSQTAA